MIQELDLEDLLLSKDKKREEVGLPTRQELTAEEIAKATEAEHPEDKYILTAESNASLFDLIKMINKLVKITMKDLNVEFVPDEDKIPVTTPDIQLEVPYITYKIIERTPKGELKPRVRQQIQEKSHDEQEARVGQVFGQKFASIIQFDIFSSVYATAEQVMERFEELLFVYAGFFKRKGISEIYFKKQFTDSSYDIYRQRISVRSIQYYVETEKLIVVFRDKIQEIETLGL